MAICGFKLITIETWKNIEESSPKIHVINRWNRIQDISFQDLKQYVFRELNSSFSQLQQDLLAQFILTKTYQLGNYKPFFVEIGAHDGIEFSNTLLLEKEFGWTGLLVEPNPYNFEKLKKNRPSAILDDRAVDSYSGIIKDFHAAANAEYSSLLGHSVHIQSPKYSNVIKVETVDLITLLGSINAPKVINYLSIDTEGNEYDIIRNFDFGKYEFDFISVEVTRNSAQIRKIFCQNNYTCILERVSAWDQWWVSPRVAETLRL